MSASNKPSAVIQRYVDYLNRVINSTISQSRLTAVGYTSAYRLIARFQNQELLPLQLSPSGWLHFQQLVRPVGSHVEVASAKYVFSHSKSPDDEKAWLVRYDYDREPPPNRPQSHMHVNAACRGKSLSRLHFPTERVSVEHVIAFLIQELDITCCHEDPMGFLGESYRGWIERRTHHETCVFP